MTRHGDIDDPIINAAIQPRAENKKDYCIPCYTCGTNNTIHARRCIGVFPDKNRCSYYFQFKECSCGIQNDITARKCRGCDIELIDPNSKLSIKKSERFILNVKQAKYWASTNSNTSLPVINVKYECDEGNAYESFSCRSDIGRKIFYSRFIKEHCEDKSKWYPHMTNLYRMQEMLQDTTLKTPYKLECKWDEFKRAKIVKKIFYDPILALNEVISVD